MKISIIGAGMVGSAAAFSLLHGIEPDEIVLIDILKNLAEGQALDLSHASVGMKRKTKIIGGDNYALASGSDYVVITAGRARKAGETREQLLDFNGKIVEEVCRKIKAVCENTKVIVVTNPSSEMTAVCKKYFEKVLGMENQLDSARLKFLISGETGISAENVKSFVSGGHGEKMEVKFLDSLSEEQKGKISEQLKNAGAEIIEKKGHSSCWGIAAQIVEAIKNF